MLSGTESSKIASGVPSKGEDYHCVLAVPCDLTKNQVLPMRTRTLLICRAECYYILDATRCLMQINLGIDWLMYLHIVCSMAQVFATLKPVKRPTVDGNMSMKRIQTFIMTIDKILQHQLLFSNLIETLFRKLLQVHCIQES